MSKYTARYRVDFVDTDAARVVHYSNFFRFVERCEQDLLRSLGFEGFSWYLDRGFGMPRVEAFCRFLYPLYLDDELEVTLEIENLAEKSVKYRFTIYNSTKRQKAAEGYLIAVMARYQDGKWRSSPLPEELREKLRSFMESRK